MAHRMERQKRIRRTLRFIFVCNFCYKNLQIRKLFSELSKRFVHKYSWVFSQDVRFCSSIATRAAAHLRNTKRCARWPWEQTGCFQLQRKWPYLLYYFRREILPPSSPLSSWRWRQEMAARRTCSLRTQCS